MKELYLDANAHVPMSKTTMKIYSDFQSSRAGWGHASAPSRLGQEAACSLETARGKLSQLLGTNPNNLIITSSCTQACDWGLDIFKKSIQEDSCFIYSSGIEHSAVYQKLESIFRKNKIKKLNNNNGFINYTEDIDTNCVVCSYVQNEIGIIQPIEKLKPKIIGLLFSDMCQAPGKIPINLEQLPVDIAAFGAHKWGGPAGIGLLYLKNFALYKEYGTGSRYFNDRPGTPDVAGVVAAAAALEEAITEMPKHLQNMQQFQSVLEDRLQDMGLKIIGKEVPRVANTTFVQIPGLAFMILNDLSRKGIYVGMGSACGSMHTGPSKTMTTLGIDGDAHDFLRISQQGNYNGNDAVYLADEIFKILKQYKDN
jgi:cysteine desulfurase